MQTDILRVTGMTCGGCSGKVMRALEDIAGVVEVDVSLSAGEATVQFDERLTSSEKLQSAVVAAGYGVNASHASPQPPAKSGCCCG